MKSFIKMTLISSAIVLALAGCDEKKTTEETPAATATTNTVETAPAENKAETANAADNAENKDAQLTEKTDTQSTKANITTEAQKESYALGSSFADYLKTNLEENYIKADQEYLISGFDETMKGASQLSKEQVKTILDAFTKRIQEESQARFEKQKTENIEAGEKFREEFAKEPA